MNLSPKNSTFHKPVLLKAALNYLGVQPGKFYIDATIGGGGHTLAILSAGGRVLGLDQDPQALQACQNHEALKPALASGALVLSQANFSRLSEIAHQHSWTPVSGILLDLGVSSHQLDSPQRGFSFRTPGPLDMRMDPGSGHPAATLVNQLPASQLAKLLSQFGDIPVSKTLSRKIVAARPLTTTSQLAKVTGKWSQTVFQALRIAVNDELGALESALSQSISLLDSGGRLVVIAYHSLEDRRIKNYFNSWQASGLGHILTLHPIRPDTAEIAGNTRSKSAKLRAFSKST